jgi:hypothetical protein
VGSKCQFTAKGVFYRRLATVATLEGRFDTEPYVMHVLGIHLIDLLVLLAYFALVLYLGVFLGAQKTKNLGDFFVAGGKWGPLVSFVFVFASAIAGNEAVAVSGQAYTSGLSGVWYQYEYD